VLSWLLALLLPLVATAVASNCLAFIVFYKKPVFRKILSNRCGTFIPLPLFNRANSEEIRVTVGSVQYHNLTW
jgi:hypothetical protein